MSRIQLGTEGRYKEAGFVVVGRIIYEYERGHWSEWHIRLSRWLQRVVERRAERVRGDASRRVAGTDSAAHRITSPGNGLC